MPTRSFLVAAGAMAANTIATIYAPPAGTTLLVKSWYGSYASTGVAATASLYLTPPAGPRSPIARVSLAPGAFYSWTGWAVVPGGGVLELQNLGDKGANYTVSGTLLPGGIQGQWALTRPAPLPAAPDAGP